MSNPVVEQLRNREQPLLRGHQLCMGCGHAITVNQLFANALPRGVRLILALGTGCLEVGTTGNVKSWRGSVAHHTFESSPGFADGIWLGMQIAIERGELPADTRVALLIGDGSVDIARGSLIGLITRGHPIPVFIMDNSGYQNTGDQWSSLTPFGASTTTSPGGAPGWTTTHRPDLLASFAACGSPYVASSIASVRWSAHLEQVAQEAFACNGPAVVHLLVPCMRGWGFPSDQPLNIADLAVETGFHKLRKIVNGEEFINYIPDPRLPVREFLERQTRFAGMLKRPEQVDRMQAIVDRDWEVLLKKAKYAP